jgi:hypothetical protein
MNRRALDFSLKEAGGLLYAADLKLGGNPFGSLVTATRIWKII